MPIEIFPTHGEVFTLGHYCNRSRGHVINPTIVYRLYFNSNLTFCHAYVGICLNFEQNNNVRISLTKHMSTDRKMLIHQSFFCKKENGQE